MAFIFYIEDRDYNDATSYYVDIIKESIEQKLGEKVLMAHSIKDITEKDIVFTIHYRTFYFVYRFTKCQKLCFWVQGILPEELELQGNTIKNKLKIYFYNRVEKIILRTASLIFFVSEDMRLHFQKKWGVEVKNYIIMPCFNKQIIKESFFTERKYTSPSFVYAGSLSSWQCIDETLVLYKEIEKQLPDSSLIILTAEVNKAKLLLKERQIKNASVNYIPLYELDSELQKYKYAFLIRDDIDVNHVATPTKMNTYLANGLIPIYSDVVGAFRRYLSAMNSSVVLKSPLDKENAVAAVVDFEKQSIIPSEILEEYSSIFSLFYNEEEYKNAIAKYIYKLFLLDKN